MSIPVFGTQANLLDSVTGSIIVETRGLEKSGDGGGGRYIRRYTEPWHELALKNRGGRIYEVQAEPDGSICSSRAGAKNDGSQDASAALQSILDAGYNIRLEPGTYLLRRGLTFRTMYQKILGAGHGARPTLTGDARENRAVSRFIVADPADQVRGYEDDTAVITMAYPHNALRGIEISMEQRLGLSAPTREDAIAYPPAVRMLANGPLIEDVAISGAWDGVHGAIDDTLDNQPGRGHFERVYVGALNVAWRIDSATGTVQFANCHVWPFGWNTPGWLNVWKAGGVTAFHLGAIDNLQMSDIIAFASHVRFAAEPYPKNPNVTRGPLGGFNNLTLDGRYASVAMESGSMNGSVLYSTTDAIDDTVITLTGDAEMTLTGINIRNPTSATPSVRVTDRARLVVVGGIVSTAGNTQDLTVFDVDKTARLIVNGVDYQSTNANPLGRFIHQRDAAVVMATGNAARPLLKSASNEPRNTFSARFIVLDGDEEHTVVGNHSGGLGNAFPASAQNGVYLGNI